MKVKIILLVLLIIVSSNNVYAKSDAQDITLEFHQNWYFLNENDALVTETISTNEDLDIPSGIGLAQNIEVVDYSAYLDDPNSLPVNTSYRPKKDGNGIHVPNFRLLKNRTFIRKFTFLQVSNPVNFSYFNLTTFYFPFDKYNFLLVIPMMDYSQNYSADIIFPASFEIEKNLTIYYPFVEFIGGFSFSWDDIGNQGNDDEKLEEFLQLYIDWVKTAKIDKIDNKTIRVSKGINYISLILNDEKTKATLKIDDGRTDELTAKTENGKLNIYPFMVFRAGHKIPKSGLLKSKSIEEYKYTAYVPEMYIPDNSQSKFFPQEPFAKINFTYGRPDLFKLIFFISLGFMFLVTYLLNPLKDKEQIKSYLLTMGSIWSVQEGVSFLQGHRPLELTLYDYTILIILIPLFLHLKSLAPPFKVLIQNKIISTKQKLKNMYEKFHSP